MDINEKVENTTYLTSVMYEIKANHIDKPIPEALEKDFVGWLEDMAVTLGTGTHHEHYIISDDYQDDIPVTFTVLSHRQLKIYG